MEKVAGEPEEAEAEKGELKTDRAGMMQVQVEESCENRLSLDTTKLNQRLQETVRDNLSLF